MAAKGHITSLTSAQKAAAILVAMGKPAAGKLLKFFKQEELKSLIDAARLLKTIPQSELEQIVAEFEDEFTEGAGLLDSGDTMNTIINETLTPEEVEALMGQGVKKLEAEIALPVWVRLEQLSTERLLAILQAEYPQTIALVLTKLRPAVAAVALRSLDREIRGDVAKRMMTMAKVPEKALALVEEQMRLRLDDEANARDNSAGQRRVASLLNELDKADLDELMMEMEAAGANDLDGLRAKLFSFEDIIQLSQKSRVALFDTVPAETVTTALRNADPGLTEAILSAIGARTRRMIEAELKDSSASPPVDDINGARKSIASEAIRLSGEGLVELPSMQEAA